MSIIHLLDAEPDLGDGLSADEHRLAHELVRLRVTRVQRGVWHPPDVEAGATGLLLLGGLLARRLTLGTASATELIGASDIIRPWEDEAARRPAAPRAEWRVLEDLKLALIDTRATATIGRWPVLSAAISGRLLRRTRSLSYLMAAQHFLRVEDRLLATLWHLAGMWGRVTPRGILVPFRLTHEILASIIGAGRPTVTTAIRSLTEQGRLQRDDRRLFILPGHAPDWERTAVPAGLEV